MACSRDASNAASNDQKKLGLRYFPPASLLAAAIEGDPRLPVPDKEAELEVHHQSTEDGHELVFVFCGQEQGYLSASTMISRHMSDWFDNVPDWAARWGQLSSCRVADVATAAGKLSTLRSRLGLEPLRIFDQASLAQHMHGSAERARNRKPADPILVDHPIVKAGNWGDRRRRCRYQPPLRQDDGGDVTRRLKPSSTIVC